MAPPSATSTETLEQPAIKALSSISGGISSANIRTEAQATPETLKITFEGKNTCVSACYGAEFGTDYLALTEIVFEWADSYDNKVNRAPTLAPNTCSMP